MFCNLKKLLCLALGVSVISMTAAGNLHAQNVTLETNELPQLSNDTDFLGVDGSIPDELSLPDELPVPDSLPKDQPLTSPDENGQPENMPEVPDLNTPQPVADNLPLIGPNAPDAAASNVDMPLTGPNANMPLTGPNANMPLTGPNANMPLTGPNANLPAIGPNAPMNGPNALPADTGALPDPVENIDAPDVENLGEGLLDQIDNKLFSQMSDLEKQTALLTLELRREKIKNEIAAIKAQRQKALEEEEAKKEEKERKRIEWEKEQEAKILRERKALMDAMAKMERLRQEKVLKAYKETMLKEKQEWIKNNGKLYEQIKNVERDRKNLIEGLKTKMAHISALATKAQKDAETAKENYQREVKNLQTQISILKSRLEAEIAEKKNDKTNPFAQPEVVVTETEEELPKLAEEYAIMEIRGKGENLTAKLINKGGDSFMVRNGTVLQTGHRIDEITQTYVRAEINGMKDYLYFAAGGILEKEPVKSDIQGKKNKTTAKPNAKAELRNTTMVNKGVPSLGSGMFVR